MLGWRHKNENQKYSEEPCTAAQNLNSDPPKYEAVLIAHNDVRYSLKGRVDDTWINVFVNNITNFLIYAIKVIIFNTNNATSPAAFLQSCVT